MTATAPGSVCAVSSVRRCARSACARRAVSTLTYNYGDQTAVLGPLALHAEPHAYDLCEFHASRLSAPRGWEILRLAPDPADAEPTHDDLLALADAVREAGDPPPEPIDPETAPERESGREAGRRGHLRMLISD